MGDFKELRDAINNEEDPIKREELQKQFDDMHRMAEEEGLLDERNYVEFEVK